VLGSAAHHYEAIHNWGELPKHVVWGETHGVTVDEAGLIYIKHRSNMSEPMDAIVVFDPAGKFVRSFGKEYSGGGHGIDIRKENGQAFLYLCDVKNRRNRSRPGDEKLVFAQRPISATSWACRWIESRTN
jgi:hypothetical protein